MIVFSSSLVLAAQSDPAIDLNAPVFGYRSAVNIETIAATDAEAGYPASNLANVSTAAFWRAANNSGTKYLTVTPTPAQELDYIAVAVHNFGSAGIAVRVEGKEAPEDSWSVLVAEFMPVNDNSLILRFDKTTYAGIRLRLAAGSEPAQAAVVYCGVILTSQRRVYVGHSPMNLGPTTEVVNGRSEQGNFLGRIVTGEYLSGSVSLSNLSPSWVRSELAPFIRAAKETPFFFAWRPAQYPDETAYCALTNDPKPSNERSNGMMSVGFEFEGVAL
jgi:hypothetical protein